MILDRYLQQLQQIHATGEAVPETSYYPAIATLLNEIGSALNPRVSCVINLKNRGAGIPDGGFFTENQLRALTKREGEAVRENPFPVQMPERGVLEVKGASEDVNVIAHSAQVGKYLARYGQVLVTNLRAWLIVTRDQNGNAVLGERWELASNTDALWAMKATTGESGVRGEEFFKRVLMQAAPLDNPQDLAWFLASYARDARTRLEAAGDDALIHLKESLEAALDMKFEGERGERFFRSTLVQTLFYGIFSAWILHCRDNPQQPFNWKLAEWSLHVPMIRALYEQVATRSHLNTLQLVEPLDWACAALNRVEQPLFFERFQQEHAVQYFYEPFLEAFDPELRRELGVWYTPPEIVRYMVERVDRALRDELGRAEGLADEDVYVLDPCCGTGAYPVEVLRRIAQTLAERGEPHLLGAQLKKAATTRVFGFEILPAPFVIAHWQIGQLLREAGAPLNLEDRAGIYLTNALTGWEEHPQKPLPSPEMQQERDLSNAVKQRAKILVILGNPPYNAFAGTATEEEGDLVAPYKKGLNTQWNIKKFNLDDLYVRFFRVAERRLTQHLGAGSTNEGIVCFISNYSWTSEPSFVVMRQSLLQSFDKIWIENLHGNRKISEYAPDGRTSETIFAQKGASAGIQQGVTIGTLVRRKNSEEQNAEVLYRDDINAAKADERRQQLLQSLQNESFDAAYEAAQPAVSNRFSFRPSDVSDAYLSWPKLTDLCERAPSNGLMEKRGGALISTDPQVLAERMKLYFDAQTSWPTLQNLETGLTSPAARFEPKAARSKVLAAEKYRPENLVPYLVRPFDLRWCYYCGVRPLWNEPRPTLWAEVWDGNAFLMSRPAGVSNPEGLPLCFASVLGDNDAVRGHAYYFPMQLRSSDDKNSAQQSLGFETTTRANLSATARKYLQELELPAPDDDTETARLLWHHALAIGYATAYRDSNADGLRADWPRVPLPRERAALQHSAQLGARVAALLDSQREVANVTTGSLPPALRVAGVLTRTDGGQINADNGDFRIAANWGHSGKSGITMPGKGRIHARPRTSAELQAAPENPTDEETLDIFLNDQVFLANVAPQVWNYTIGGYQVLKKWLSYREFSVLGRDLTLDELREITATVRRLTALCALESALDQNYHTCAEDTYQWPQ